MSKLKYETPEVEMISFETKNMIMNGIVDSGMDGQVIGNPLFNGSGVELDNLNGAFGEIDWSKY